ncbi:MAG: hypothetical protein M3453_08640 [Pseudomonadota bacterium]|nr:hypothetical protein [Pseudomonadota bacterium]
MSPAISATLVTFLLDRTGSMEAIKDDTIGGFNAYLGALKADGAGIEFSLLQFDSISIDKVCVNTPIADVALLTQATFQPRASTPLIDAAYKTIKAVETAVAARADAPKVVISIQTDGQENCSTEHGWDELNLLIKEKAALGWQFNFLGAGIDAYEQGQRMGIAAASTLSYDAKDRAATQAAFSGRAARTAAYAKGDVADMLFSPEEKRRAGDKFDPTGKPANSAGTGKPTGPAKRRKAPLVDDITL